MKERGSIKRALEKAHADWKVEAKAQRKWECALRSLREKQRQQYEQTERMHQSKRDEVAQDAAEQEMLLRDRKKKLNAIESQISEMRGRNLHLVQEYHAWEHDMRAKMESQYQDLVLERKKLQLQKAAGMLLSAAPSAAPSATMATSVAPSAEEWKELVLVINLDRCHHLICDNQSHMHRHVTLCVEWQAGG